MERGGKFNYFGEGSKHKRFWLRFSSKILNIFYKWAFIIFYINNFEVLLFNRAEKSTFYPNSAVFPGGVHEIGDASLLWLNYIKSFGQSTNRDLFQCNSPRPAIFTNKMNGQIQRYILIRFKMSWFNLVLFDNQRIFLAYNSYTRNIWGDRNTSM